MPQFLTQSECAKKLGVSKQQFHTWTKDASFPSKKARGKRVFDPAAVEQWRTLRKQKRGPDKTPGATVNSPVNSAVNQPLALNPELPPHEMLLGALTRANFPPQQLQALTGAVRELRQARESDHRHAQLLDPDAVAGMLQALGRRYVEAITTSTPDTSRRVLEMLKRELGVDALALNVAAAAMLNTTLQESAALVIDAVKAAVLDECQKARAAK